MPPCFSSNAASLLVQIRTQRELKACETASKRYPPTRRHVRLRFRKSRRAYFHNVVGSKAKDILQSMCTPTLQHRAQPALVSWAHLKRVQLTALSQHSALFSRLCSAMPLCSHMLCNTVHPEACSHHQISGCVTDTYCHTLSIDDFHGHT
jgi:hypothetical protein